MVASMPVAMGISVSMRFLSSWLMSSNLRITTSIARTMSDTAHGFDMRLGGTLDVLRHR